MVVAGAVGILIKTAFPIVTNQLDQDRLIADLDASFGAHGYQVILFGQANEFLFQKNDCLGLGKVSLYIDDDTSMANVVQGVRGYVFQSKYYRTRPLILPIVYSATGRIASIFGSSTRFSPVYAVVTGDSCTMIDWSILPDHLEMLSFSDRYEQM